MSWITVSGSLGTVQILENFSATVEYDSGGLSGTFILLNGSLPPGLTLSPIVLTGNILNLTIAGVPARVESDTTFGFVIRAVVNGLISDRTFYISVYGPVAPLSHATINNDGNLGTFPDGTRLNIDVSGTELNPTGNLTYSILQGNLPAGLSLNNNTGQITGYVNPSVLVFANNGFDSSPSDTDPFDLGLSTTSLTFSFNLLTNDGQQSVVAPYTLSIERLDVFNNPNANISLPYYHPPLLLDATYTYDSTANIVITTLDLDSADADTNFYYQLQGYDFENDLLGYEFVGGQPDVPQNLSVDVNTGLISGYIFPNQTSLDQFSFDIRIYKVDSEPTDPTQVNPYQTVVATTLSINTHFDQDLEWQSPNILTNLSVGQASTLSVEAIVTNPTIPTLGSGAAATVTLKLNSVSILNGGTGYVIGDQLPIIGGSSQNPASITVASVGPQNQILSITINSGIQGYTVLPILDNVVVTGGSGHSAIMNLSFNLEQVSITNRGLLYTDATIGFSSTGEITPASAVSTISDGFIENITITNAGNGYLTVPNVLINAKNNVLDLDPIKYSVISGELPLGLTLTSNGLIEGRASYSIITDTTYTFTVRASVSINQDRVINEINREGYPGSTEIHQLDREEIFEDQVFTLNVLHDQVTPRSNIYLQFFLKDDDRDYLTNLVNDQTVFPIEYTYRLGDPNFGIPNTQRMLIGYGLDTVTDDQIAVLRNNHAKRFIFQNLNMAQALDDSSNVLYEIIYITSTDRFTTLSGVSLSGNISIMYNGGIVTARPNSYTNMAADFRAVSEFSQKSLPLWMTSIQTSGNVLGFTQAIPIAYVIPGTGQRVLYNLQQKLLTQSRNLNTINATVNCYLWDDQLAVNFDKDTNSFPVNLPTTFQDNTVWDIGNISSTNGTSFGNVTVDQFEPNDDGDKYLILNYDNFIDNGIPTI